MKLKWESNATVKNWPNASSFFMRIKAYKQMYSKPKAQNKTIKVTKNIKEWQEDVTWFGHKKPTSTVETVLL